MIDDSRINQSDWLPAPPACRVSAPNTLPLRGSTGHGVHGKIARLSHIAAMGQGTIQM